jgi:hypothetical protein
MSRNSYDIKIIGVLGRTNSQICYFNKLYDEVAGNSVTTAVIINSIHSLKGCIRLFSAEGVYCRETMVNTLKKLSHIMFVMESVGYTILVKVSCGGDADLLSYKKLTGTMSEESIKDLNNLISTILRQDSMSLTCFADKINIIFKSTACLNGISISMVLLIIKLIYLLK